MLKICFLFSLLAASSFTQAPVSGLSRSLIKAPGPQQILTAEKVPDSFDLPPSVVNPAATAGRPGVAPAPVCTAI